MTQALPDILTALSKLIPHRILWLNGWAVWDTSWGAGYQSIGDTRLDLPRLEYALREECEARGWRWQVTSDSDNGLYGSEIAAQLAPQGQASYFYAGEPTPAQSLAACLLAALEAAQAAAVAADRQAHPESKFDEVGLA